MTNYELPEAVKTHNVGHCEELVDVAISSSSIFTILNYISLKKKIKKTGGDLSVWRKCAIIDRIRM